jgi:hypothetical protein
MMTGTASREHPGRPRAIALGELVTREYDGLPVPRRVQFHRRRELVMDEAMGALLLAA